MGGIWILHHSSLITVIGQINTSLTRNKCYQLNNVTINFVVTTAYRKYVNTENEYIKKT